MSAREDILDKLLGDLDVDGDVVFRFSEKQDYFDQGAHWVHTGSPHLDYSLGTYGFPTGLVELTGDSLAGKTTLALAALYWFQQQNPDGLVLIMSSENRDNEPYAKRIGINTKKVVILRASNNYLEDMVFHAQILMDKFSDLWTELGYSGKPPILIIWDSVGMTNSRAEMETYRKNVDEYRRAMTKKIQFKIAHARMADFAKAAKMLMKAILGQIYDLNITLLAINHKYEAISNNAFKGKAGKKSGGGKWVEYLPCLRLDLVRTSWITYEVTDDDGEKKREQVAQTVLVKVVKNDFGPRRETEIVILLGQGIVLSDADLKYAVKKGILEQSGKSIRIYKKGKLRWSTPRQFYSYYKDNNIWLKFLHKEIMRRRHKDLEEKRGGKKKGKTKKKKGKKK